MIRHQKHRINSDSWFIGFDQAEKVNDTQVSKTQKISNIQKVSSLSLSSIPSEISSLDLNVSDAYKEAFSNSQKREEKKFKSRFENILIDLYHSLESQSQLSSKPPNFYSTQYADIRYRFRRRVKDLIRLSIENFQIVHENYKQCHGSPAATSHAIRNLVSRLVEDGVGEILDWSSDEAVSDLSTSTDDGWSDLSTSYEEQLSQAVINKAFERHKRDIEEKHEQEEDDDLYNRIFNDNVNGFDYDKEFDKLVSRACRVIEPDSSRLSPIEEAPVKEEAPSRKISTVMVPDWNDRIDFSSTDIDPDSLTLSNDKINEIEFKNWAFTSKTYSPLSRTIISKDLTADHEIHVPKSGLLDTLNGISNGISDNGNFDEVSTRKISIDESMFSNNSQDSNDDFSNIHRKISLERLANVNGNSHSKRVSDSSMLYDSYNSPHTSFTERRRDRLKFDSPDVTDSKQTASKLNNYDFSPINKSSTSGLSESATIEPISNHEKSSTSIPPSLRPHEILIPSPVNDPKFEVSPTSTSVMLGENTQFSCKVPGSRPLDVFWYSCRGTDMNEIHENEKFELIEDVNSYQLMVYSVNESDQVQYMCQAINEHGQACKYFTLTTQENTESFSHPEFITRLEDKTVNLGQSVKFRCKVKGIPPCRVMWFKDGKHLDKTNDSYSIERFGNRDYILSIDAATPDCDAEYSVVATNACGQARSTAQLIINDTLSNDDKLADLNMLNQNDTEETHVSSDKPTLAEISSSAKPGLRRMDEKFSNHIEYIQPSSISKTERVTEVNDIDIQTSDTHQCMMNTQQYSKIESSQPVATANITSLPSVKSINLEKSTWKSELLNGPETKSIFSKDYRVPGEIRQSMESFENSSNSILDFGPKPIPVDLNRDFIVKEKKPRKWEVKLPSATIITANNAETSVLKSNTNNTNKNEAKSKLIELQPAKVHIIGQTREEEVPSTSFEFNQDVCSDLPSVNNLKKLFCQPNHKNEKTTVNAVHSITARRLSRSQLQSYKDNGSEMKCEQKRASLPLDYWLTAENKPDGSVVEAEQSLITNIKPIKISESKLNQSKVSSLSQSRSTPVLNLFKESSESTHELNDVDTSAMEKSNCISNSNCEQKEQKKLKIKPGSIQARAAFWNRRIQDNDITNDDVNELYPNLLE